ncbi:aminotransferase class V-fold PLP-dependent enzyme [Chitinimonas taiwanensis]|uniref:Selenocysteine lyase/Cysteine desulfurase n=1 Tax=Chitinimonas taiwanensis DSM 18899 TaxID=1121279 RepID=A0A1K2HPP9_9NEIS|nr:aminotransferase class V-fold PLP-dependent enzyme [Chitinimonas taiwanensis]SFZ78735.1 Selenocysteine lyase/Cysteine desulfurase [Chitinimonas taiwanensis DSM 18899]
MEAPIHLNTAGAGLPADVVSRSMCHYLQQEAQRGAYETELAHAEILEHGVYQSIAQLIGAQASDIALFDSATRAWHGLLRLCRFGPADRVWVTPYEYAGNLIALINWQRQYGFQLEVIPLDPHGDIDLAWMRRHLDDAVALISVVHVPSGCGTVSPLHEIATLVAGRRCWFVVDACQSVGQIPIDIRSLGCDVLTAAGRKFLRGPRGTAFAYLSPRFRAAVPPDFCDLHVAQVQGLHGYRVAPHSARIYELAERNMAAVVGLHAAVQYHLGRDTRNAEAVFAQLMQGLAKVPDTRLIAPGTRQQGIISFQHRKRPAGEIVDRLRARGFNSWVMTGHHTPILMEALGVDTAVRLSVHYYNSSEQIEQLLRVIPEVLA